MTDRLDQQEQARRAMEANRIRMAKEDSRLMPKSVVDVVNDELQRLYADLAEAVALLRSGRHNPGPGPHQPEWDARKAALLAKHPEQP